MAKKTTTIVKSSFICAVFEISQPTLTRWVQAGCPKSARNVYDFKNVLEWFLEHIYKSDPGDAQGNMEDAKFRFWKAKSEREALRAATERGELEKKEDIKRASATAARQFKDNLQNLPARISAVVAAKSKKSEKAIYQILRKEINGALLEMLESLKKISGNEQTDG